MLPWMVLCGAIFGALMIIQFGPANPADLSGFWVAFIMICFGLGFGGLYIFWSVNYG